MRQAFVTAFAEVTVVARSEQREVINAVEISWPMSVGDHEGCSRCRVGYASVTRVPSPALNITHCSADVAGA